MAENKNWDSDRDRMDRDKKVNPQGSSSQGDTSGSRGSSSSGMSGGSGRITGGSRGRSSGSYGSNIGEGSKGSDESMDSESDFERNRGRRSPSDEDISE